MLAKSIIEDLCKNEYCYLNEKLIDVNSKIDLFGNKLTKDKHYAITHDESESMLYAIVTLIKYNESQFFKYREILHTDSEHVCDWSPLI